MRLVLLIMAAGLFQWLAIPLLTHGTLVAYSFLLATFALCALGERYYLAHHSSGKYDDRLTDKRIEEAREWIVARFRR